MDNSAEPDEQAEEEQATAPAPTAEVVQTADSENEDVAAKKPAKHTRSDNKKGRRASRPSRKNQPTLQHVSARFAACGRCSYFWMGYRVIFGEEALATAVTQSQSGWLDLEWNLQMPELVHKSYGVRLDVTHLHLEGCCQECRRTFVYQAAEEEDEADAFRIEISPRITK